MQLAITKHDLQNTNLENKCVVYYKTTILFYVDILLEHRVIYLQDFIIYNDQNKKEG